MSRRQGRAVGARRTWLAVAVVGAVSIGATLWFNTAPLRASRAAAQHADGSPAAPQATNAPFAGGPAANALPASLNGSSPPRLPLVAGGRLAHTRAVRDFFDYFLSAQSEMSATALDALVRRQIAAQLEGTAANDEAVAVWQRYTAYLTARDQLPQPASMPGSKLDLDAVQLALDQRDALSTRMMGEWSKPFFGDEQQRQRNDLARLRINSDPTLTEAEKAARLATLDATLPPQERAARERARQQQASVDEIAQLQKQGASLDEMRAQIAQKLGPAAAERVVQMQKDDDAWRARYADYASQRAQIDKRGLSQPDHDAQVAQLRRQFFTNPAEAMRAASLDGGAGG
ncbi:lipase secretion chaperone [Paraburkholderia phenazinium]|uniref:Lipase chaperone n=1 Tax=Paraburkholderia phenazinium TaxID=60549 RepID=A0A1G7U8S2_9BURK|nr:lipase secretion chaperone [Paraburkholderia phenazinium]SDG43966.1 Lipase chaperone LimK [Paraburkholderia phenazinium]